MCDFVYLKYKIEVTNKPKDVTKNRKGFKYYFFHTIKYLIEADWIGIFALVLTAIFGFLIWIYFDKYPHAFSNAQFWQHPNIIGDFLAGTVGILALLWLIVGYAQQGRELKQNTQALLAQQKEMEKQADELNRQVTATKEMAKAMMRMAKSNEKIARLSHSKFNQEVWEADESVKPKFNFQWKRLPKDNGEFWFHFWIANTGKDISDFKINSINEKLEIKLLGKSNKLCEINYIRNKNNYSWPINLKICYQDLRANIFEHDFYITEKMEFKENQERIKLSEVNET